MNKLPRLILSAASTVILIVAGLVSLLGSTSTSDDIKQSRKVSTKKESPKAQTKKKQSKGEDKGYTSPDWWKPGEKSNKK